MIIVQYLKRWKKISKLKSHIVISIVLLFYSNNQRRELLFLFSVYEEYCVDKR